MKHGMSKHPAYKSWVNMRLRCNVPTTTQYKDYGGRGIKVCPEWQKSFLSFYEDMGDPPEGFTLDRVDNDEDYSPDNCRWVSRLQQNQNRRLRCTNKSGIPGVFWYRERTYAVYHDSPQGRKNLGYTPDFFEACCIRKGYENASPT
jgi:hypothetical protein